MICMHTPQIRTCKTDAFEMEYFSFGSGLRPFIIIPGVSMTSVMPAAAALAAGFGSFTNDWTVYVFDRKKDIQEGYSVLDMAEDTAAALTALGLKGCDIFGASQGGMIAQCIAIRHPELVHALYLGSTMARPNAACREVMERWLTLVDAGQSTPLNHEVNTRIYSKEYYARYQAIFASMEDTATPEQIRRFGVLVKACLEFDVYDRLDRIQCPVFVVGSHADRVVTAAASEELADKLHCPLYLYEGFSHAVYDEAPDYRERMKESLLSVAD